jgi:CheY-like chemotaxis protein
MDPANLTWGLAVAALATIVGLGLWWRAGRQRQAERQRQSDAAAAAVAAVAASEQALRERADAAAAAAAARQASVSLAAQAAAESAAAETAALETRAREAAAEAAEAAAAAAEAALAMAAAEAARRVAEAETVARQAMAEVRPADTGPPVPGAAASPRSPAETLVMVADDSKVVRVKTSRLLTQHGYRVVLAEDGAQAAQLIDGEIPDVLITDVEMPGLDGFALTRHVRAHPRAQHIPVIMITAADDRLKQAAAAAGVTLVLGKPYPEADLLACIEQSRRAAATAWGTQPSHPA